MTFKLGKYIESQFKGRPLKIIIKLVKLDQNCQRI